MSEKSNFEASEPAKMLKSNSGGVAFVELALNMQCLYSQKYTGPHRFFAIFAGLNEKNNLFLLPNQVKVFSKMINIKI